MHTAIQPLSISPSRSQGIAPREIGPAKRRTRKPLKTFRSSIRPKDTAYKTATGSNFFRQLKKSGLTFEQLVRQSLSGLHYQASFQDKKRVERLKLGQGQEFSVYRIPIKGFEGYALRVPSYLHNHLPDLFDPTFKIEIGLNQRLTQYNHPLEHILTAGVPLCGARINPFTSLQVVRRLPGTDFVPQKRKNVSDLKRVIQAHKMLLDMPQRAFNQLARVSFKMDKVRQRFDHCLGNLININGKQFGVIDTVRDDENWYEQMLGLSRIPLVNLRLLSNRLKEKDLQILESPLLSISRRLLAKVKRAISAETKRQRELNAH